MTLFTSQDALDGLPELPPHAKYVFHPGSPPCYDWGMYGWLLNSGHVSPGRYRYFFFLSASARGPFLPAYARVRESCAQGGCWPEHGLKKDGPMFQSKLDPRPCTARPVYQAHMSPGKPFYHV